MLCIGVAIGIGFIPDLHDNAKFLVKLAALILASIAISVVAARIFRPRVPLRGFAINAGVAIVAITMGLAAAEFAIRYAYSDITTTANNEGYFSGRYRALNPRRYNRWGFNDRDVAQNAPVGTYRIAVIGDSITFGQGIRPEKRMTTLLEKRLNTSNRKFEVLNFGRPGAETVDQQKILEEVVLGLNPDYILLQWYPNDAEGRDKTGRPAVIRPLPFDVPNAVLLRHSALYTMVSIGLNRLAIQLGWRGNYLDYMTARFGDPSSADSVAYDKVLRKFIATVRERGIPMGIVLYPKLAAVKDGKYSLEFLHARVKKACADLDLSCMDMTATVSSVEDRPSLEVSELDSHPSALANQMVAGSVFRAFGGAWQARNRGMVNK